MKKRYVQTFFVVCFFGSLLYAAPVMGLEDKHYRDIKNEATINEVIESTEEDFSTEEAMVSFEQNETCYVTSASETEEAAEIDLVTQKIFEAQMRIEALEAENSMEWFKKYKEIQNEYSEWINTDETIYDVFSETELDLLFRIVETEVRGDENFDEKANVCSVIFNRLYDQTHFSDVNTLAAVITQQTQFSSYTSGAYKRVSVTDTTRLACEYAFQIGDTTGGALWFDSTNRNSWAEHNRSLSFTDEVGHNYYN